MQKETRTKPCSAKAIPSGYRSRCIGDGRVGELRLKVKSPNEKLKVYAGTANRAAADVDGVK